MPHETPGARGRKAGAAVAGVTAVAGVAVALAAIQNARSGETHLAAARSHAAPVAAAAPARAATLTSASIARAITNASSTSALTVDATTVRGSAIVGRDVIASVPGGTGSDSYYDASNTLTSVAGQDRSGKSIYVDYATKSWYPSPGGVPGVSAQWLSNGLSAGTLHLAGPATFAGHADTKITGKDTLGSRVTIYVANSSKLPDEVITDEPAGVTTQHYLWGAAAGTAARAAATASNGNRIVVTAPASFKHLAAAPAATAQPKGNG